MGARLSQPRGPGGTTESSAATKAPPPPTPGRPFPRSVNSRTIVAPVAAFTMACILFVYARTSIRAAKANAQRHRDADSGGQGVNLLNESRRRHGLEKRIDSGNTVTELASELKTQIFGSRAKDGEGEKGVNRRGLREEEERRRVLREARSRSREG